MIDSFLLKPPVRALRGADGVSFGTETASQTARD